MASFIVYKNLKNIFLVNKNIEIVSHGNKIFKLVVEGGGEYGRLIVIL